tara:strand:- start:297 stop:446 length:150 start_codon:yes stop_codon:yes gene_type:complete
MYTPSAKELLKHIEDKLEHGKFIDSVHKIKLMTTRDMIRSILETEFKKF